MILVLLDYLVTKISVSTLIFLKNYGFNGNRNLRKIQFVIWKLNFPRKDANTVFK
jgi:hypothetical protein